MYDTTSKVEIDPIVLCWGVMASQSETGIYRWGMGEIIPAKSWDIMGMGKEYHRNDVIKSKHGHQAQ